MINKRRIILTLCLLMLVLILSACQSKTDEIPTEAVVEKETPVVEEENIISVSTTEQFLSAIGPNRTIKVASGEYDLLSVITDNEHIKYEDTYDGKELIIYKVENLKIIGDENSKPNFVIDPRYSNVMVFKDVDNLTIKNIVAGHRKELGECSGGVLQFNFSDNVILENLDLYGCGTIGIDLKDSEKFQIINPNIYECNYGAMTIENSSDIEIVGGNIHDNTVFEALIKARNSKQIVFNGTTFNNNKSYTSEGYVSYDYFVMNESDTPINFNNCVIKDNELEYFYFKKDQYTNTVVKDNKFIVDTDKNDLYNNSYIMREQSWYEVKIKESTDWLASINISNTQLVREKAIVKYTKLIEDLGVLDLNGVPTALTSFKNMSRTIDNKETSDELFAIFLEYYGKYMDVASYSMYSYTELGKIYNENNPFGFVDLDNVKDDKLRLKVESSINSGIKLDAFYENVYTTELNGYVVSKVEAFVSEGMRKYLELREEERSNQSYEYEELGMNIEYNYHELDRLVKWEKFYVDYPDFLEKDKFVNYVDRYEFTLKQPFENIKSVIIDEGMYNQNDFYMLSAVDLMIYERLFDLYPYSAYTSKYKDLIDEIKKTNNIIMKDLEPLLIEKKILEEDGNYDDYFKNSADYYNTINKFKLDLSKFKEEVKKDPVSNVSTELTTVLVDDIYQMFREIADNKHIIMKSGVYKVSLDFLSFSNGVDRENTISGVKNLVIESDSDEPVVLLLDYGVVLKIDNSENVLLNNFVLGHSTDICNGNVIEIVNSKNISVNNSLLYGSGYIGFYVDTSENVNLNRSLVTDTTTNPVSIIDSKVVAINNSRVYENYVPYLFDIDNSSEVTIDSTQIIFNAYEKDQARKGKEILKMDKVNNVVIKNSYFIENNFENIYSKEFDEVVQFTDNITN